MGLKEKFACSYLTSPAGGVCDKVLVPADYLQAINCWVHFIRSGHSVRLGE